MGENERLERGDVIETLGILEGGLNGGGEGSFNKELWLYGGRWGKSRGTSAPVGGAL